MAQDFDWISMQKQAHREFGTRLGAVIDWDAPTPDSDWSISDLVSHVIEEQQWVPHLLTGRTVAEAKRRLQPLGDDLRAEWRLYSLAAMAAWAEAPKEILVSLSHDTVSVDDYLREQVSDVTIHAWDLARATGSDEHLDVDLIEAVWTVFAPQRDTLSASGLFASPVELDDDAPLQSRLLALTGRDDRSR